MARLLTIMLLCCMVTLSVAKNTADAPFVTISGTVKDKDSKKNIGNVSISLDASHIATVSNNDGTFSLTIPMTSANGKIKAEQLGYFSRTISLSDLPANGKDITILMTSSAKMLKEVVVRGGKPDEIVAEALKKIPVNYSHDKNLFTAFYRETVQKGKREISSRGEFHT